MDRFWFNQDLSGTSNLVKSEVIGTDDIPKPDICGSQGRTVGTRITDKGRSRNERGVYIVKKS